MEEEQVSGSEENKDVNGSQEDKETTENKEQAEQSSRRIQRSWRILVNNAWSFLKSTLSLREGLDQEGTIEGIRKDVEFRGHAAWILVCSILIASIGLSVGNIPIIVGAMLISPLMGPILGIGLAAGTNDLDLLKKSVTNFIIAMVISILISSIYFLIIPMPEISFELRDRKQATLLAIAVALFGGAAGIIAGSRRYKSNVVPGVAIATALMPPLCTVGFGLATASWDYFFGALYLFFINSVFIALPTYFYIRYMNFPVKEFIDPIRERKIKRRISVFLMITVIPSAFIFYNVLRQSFFTSDANLFLVAVEQSLEQRNTTIIDQKVIYDPDKPMIKIALMGDPISTDLRNQWEELRVEYGLQNCELDIREPRDFTQAIEALREENMVRSTQQMEEFYRTQIKQREEEIQGLERELNLMRRGEGEFQSISAEVKMLFPGLKRAAFANLQETNFSAQPDTIPTLMVLWPDNLDEEEVNESEEQLNRWLRARLKDPDARVVHYSLPVTD